MNSLTVLANVREVAERFARDRMARQRRRELDPADFDRLREAGFLLVGAPSDQGGLWESAPRSTRTICELVRTIARGDASVALVCAMHPSVLAFWLAMPEVDEPSRPAWAEQRRMIFETARGGAWWGTVTSEPGSGGDIFRTAAVARQAGDAAEYRLAGHKHFGSGSGIASFMLTSAVPDGEPEPDLFFLDVRGAAWDGSSGMKLTAPWDGHGMIATQSHGFLFEEYPAARIAWPGHLRQLLAAAGPVVGCCFTAAIVGVVEAAIAAAQEQLERRRASLRPYEQVEWVRAGMEAWLIQQAYEGMLRAVEGEEQPALAVLRGKTAIAELAAAATERLCRVMGGGSYARYSPFGFWAQDVRALGFLRPPWGLAYDTLYTAAWASPPPPDEGAPPRTG
jgi:alkylation response protein AidB-like acyl-CoA dehydrogenase